MEERNLCDPMFDGGFVVTICHNMISLDIVTRGTLEQGGQQSNARIVLHNLERGLTRYEVNLCNLSEVN